MRVLIVGCGYLGVPLGADLAHQGHEVYGVRRSAGAEKELLTVGIKPVVADITQSSALSKLPGPLDWVVNCASSTKGGVEEYRQVYLAGTRNLIDWLSSGPPRKLVYTSSTSVYGQRDGSLVKETSAIEPVSETSKLLVETEQLLLV